MPLVTDELTDQALLQQLSAPRILVVGSALEDTANALDAVSNGFLKVTVDPRRTPTAWELY